MSSDSPVRKVAWAAVVVASVSEVCACQQQSRFWVLGFEKQFLTETGSKANGCCAWDRSHVYYGSLQLGYSGRNYFVLVYESLRSKSERPRSKLGLEEGSSFKGDRSFGLVHANLISVGVVYAAPSAAPIPNRQGTTMCPSGWACHGRASECIRGCSQYCGESW